MERPLGKSTIASTAGIGAPLLALGLVVVVAVVTSSVTGSAFFFESFCGVILTAMLWVLPSGALRTGDWTAPAAPADRDGYSDRDGDGNGQTFAHWHSLLFRFGRSASHFSNRAASPE